MTRSTTRVLAADALFLHHSRRYLETEFLPRIREAVAPLSPAELWWRPNPASNSIGNLLLHLAGNIRQGIVSGVGGEPDTRTRDAEFDTRETLPLDPLLERLDHAVRDAVRVIEALPPERLTETVTVQGRDVSVLDAIYHVVEHFSMHTGQSLYIAKALRAEDLGLYEMIDGQPRAKWPGNERG